MRILSWALLALLFCGAALADDAPRMSLVDAVRTALHAHPRMRRAVADVQAEIARKQRAASVETPKLSFESSAQLGPEGAPNFSFFGLANAGIANRSGVDMVVSQNFDFGRTVHEVRARAHAVEAARDGQDADTLWVVANVYESYFDALLARDLLTLAEENVQAREAVAREAEARFHNGLSARVDVDLARTSLAEGQAALIRARGDMRVAFARLNTAMGVEGSPSYELSDDFPAPTSSPVKLDDAMSKALQQRPDRKASTDRIRSAEENLRARNAGSSPILRLLASGGSVNGPPSTNNTYAVGVGLSWPLYTGGAVEADVAEARQTLASLRATDEELAQRIRLEVTQVWTNLTSLAESQPAVDEQVRQAQDGEHLAYLRYKHELGGMVELQQAELASLTARISAAKLRYDILKASAMLHYTVGDPYP